MANNSRSVHQTWQSSPMIRTYLTLQDHYARVLDLIHDNPYEVIVATYSTGRTKWDREVEYGILQTELNWLGLVISELHRRMESRLIGKVSVITTEPPQEVEIIEQYPKIQWRQHRANHAKIWFFRYKTRPDRALVGSRNLTSTLFQEITVELKGEDARLTGEAAMALLQQSEPLDQEQDWFSQVDEVGL
jgi:hypothetical protein